MADYTPLISRAVAALTENTGEARRAVYDRARTALIAQLRGMDPPLAEEHVTRERLALEEAIRKVEADNAAESLDAMLERELADITAAVATARPQPAAADGAKQVSEAAEKAETLGDAAANAKRAAQDQLVAADGPAAVQDRVEPRVDFGGGPGGATPPAAEDGQREPTIGPIRPRVSVLGSEDEVEPPRKGRGGMIAAGIVLVILAGAAAAGWYFATQSDRTPGQATGPRPTPPAQPAAPQDGERPKITDRVGGDQPAPATPPAAAPSEPATPPVAPQDSQPATPPPADDTQPPAPAEPPAAPPAGAPQPAVPPPASDGTTPPAPPPAGSTAAPPTSPVTVAQGAALFEETPGNQAGTLMRGTVIWRTQTVSVGRGQPPDLVLVGEVTIPERRMTVTLTIRRNLDETLPATHTIEVVFGLPREFEFRGVSEVPGILMKASEQARGQPLIGQAVRVTNGFFFVGLSAALDSDKASNIEALRSRAFIDIPMRYDNGRRAILTIEKGVSGERAFAEALSAWGQ